MALTKVKLIADGAVKHAHIDPNSVTTDSIGEGAGNLFYTDARVASYLSTNNYATSAAGYFTAVSHDTVNKILTFTKSNSTTEQVNLTQYIDDTNLARLTSGTVNASTGIATFTRDDASTFTVDFSSLLDDTNDYVTSASFNTTDGVLTLTRFGGTNVTVDLDGRYLQGYTETDPTVPSHVKTISTTNISNWNTAYGWGNHAGLYASASHTHSYLPLSGGTLTGDLSMGSQEGTWISSSAMSDSIGWNPSYGVYIGSNVGGTHYLRANGTFTTGGNTYNLIHSGNKDSYTYPPATHTHSYVSEGGTSFNGKYPVVVRVGANNFYSDANIQFEGANSQLTVDGSIVTPILYDSNNTGYYVDPASTSNLNGITSQGESNFRTKRHYFGLSDNWDGVGGSSLTNVHLNGHNQFWIGAGNGTWFTGTANTKSQVSGLAADATNAHDLLITTMQGTSTTDRGITFAVDDSGNQNSGWRLGKWHSGDAKDSSKLVVDGGFFVKGGYTDEYDYYADDYSAYYSSQGGTSYWTGGTNAPSITASTAIMIQSGNKDSNTRNPQLQFHQYGYGGVQLRYDGPNDRMYLEPLGTNRLDWTRFQTDSGYIEFGPANTTWAHIYTDRGGFYLNKALTVSGGSAINSGDMRAPIFYDSNSTNYYVNPNGTSSLLHINMNNGTLSNVNNITFNDPGVNEGLEWIGGNGWKIFESPDSLTNASGNLQIITGGTRRFAIDTSGNSYSLGSSRAPIFYDSNNTGYYIDPAGTHRQNYTLGNTASFGRLGVNNTSASSKYGLSLYGGYNSGEPTYGMMFSGTAYNGTHGGVTSDWATYFTMSNTSSRGWIFRRAGVGNYASISASGLATFDNSVRSPIFYDSNDTGYYVDPASLSALRSIITDSVQLGVSGGAVKGYSSGGNTGLQFQSNASGGYRFDAQNGNDYGYEFSIGDGNYKQLVDRLSYSEVFSSFMSGGGPTGGLPAFAFGNSSIVVTTSDWTTSINTSNNFVWGNMNVSGTFYAATKYFRIDHPLKPETHDLVHSVVESSRADVYYRGKSKLVNGSATINIDEYVGMTEGTFEALTKDVQCFTTNEDSWTNVKGNVVDNLLTIIAQDETCEDNVSWLVFGERNDDVYINRDDTDENGRLILEPEAIGTMDERREAFALKSKRNELTEEQMQDIVNSRLSEMGL